MVFVVDLSFFVKVVFLCVALYVFYYSVLFYLKSKNN